MSSKKKSTSLSDKISDLLTTVPKTYGSDDDAEETTAKVVDYEEESDDLDNLNDFKREFNSLQIRKQNVSLLEDSDKRYAGKKVSKKEIFNEDESFDDSYDDDDNSYDENGDHSIEESIEENNESDNEEDDISLKFSDKASDAEDDNADAKLSNENNHEQLDFEEDFHDSIATFNPKLMDKNNDKAFKTLSTINFREELQKSNCVKEQLRIWENLLELRIKFHKCLVTSNKLPQYDVYKNYESNDEFKVKSKSVKNKLSDLLNNLLQLQNSLLNNFPETKDILIKSKKRKLEKVENEISDDQMDEEIPSDTEDEINGSKQSSEQEDSEKSDIEEKKEPVRKKIKIVEFENILTKNYKSYTEYRNSIIQKWNDKTRIAAGIISKKGNEPVLKQIEFILSNKDKLLKKTQLKRSEYDIIGKSANSTEDSNELRVQEYDSEIFDDDDFYHQLLRDLIEFKSADVTDPIKLSKQWIQLQNMRSKLKRKIDTRATKGRRLRYNVHTKLVNFMAPITTNDTWTDRAKDELYNSLFGKIKPAGDIVPTQLN